MILYIGMKSVFDYIIAVLVLALFSPLLLLVALAIKLDSKGPVFYLQNRVGKGGKEFKIIKFRTMNKSMGNGLTSGLADPRITRVGRIIRKMHLDEFTQLINVLKGDMSLVGPRPEILEFTKHYPKLWSVVLMCKPGITGLAALKCADYEYATLAKTGRPEQVYIKKILPKKLRYDAFYVAKRSIGFDMLIIFWTIKRLLVNIF